MITSIYHCDECVLTSFWVIVGLLDQVDCDQMVFKIVLLASCNRFAKDCLWLCRKCVLMPLCKRFSDLHKLSAILQLFFLPYTFWIFGYSLTIQRKDSDWKHTPYHCHVATLGFKQIVWHTGRRGSGYQRRKNNVDLYREIQPITYF